MGLYKVIRHNYSKSSQNGDFTVLFNQGILPLIKSQKFPRSCNFIIPMSYTDSPLLSKVVDFVLVF